MQYLKRALCALTAPLVMVLTVFSGFSQAYADDLPTYRIGITPSQNNMGTLEPGTTYEGKFTVKNTGRETFDYEIDFAPYGVEGDNYDPVYDKPSSYTEISDWITVSRDSGTIASGDAHEIGYRIAVPADAYGGAQSAVIIARMLNPESDKNSTAVETVQQLGFLVFGNVDGDATRTAKILENNIPSILFKSPITVTSIVENTGNVYGNASYTLQVFPLFSDEEVYTTEEDPELKVIFPETKRLSEQSWEGAPALGIFKVRQTVKLFDEVSVEEKLVFLCPLWLIVVVAILIVLIIFWIVSHIRNKNRY